jgi:hypothetical protein
LRVALPRSREASKPAKQLALDPGKAEGQSIMPDWRNQYAVRRFCPEANQRQPLHENQRQPPRRINDSPPRLRVALPRSREASKPAKQLALDPGKAEGQSLMPDWCNQYAVRRFCRKRINDSHSARIDDSHRAESTTVPPRLRVALPRSREASKPAKQLALDPGKAEGQSLMPDWCNQYAAGDSARKRIKDSHTLKGD